MPALLGIGVLVTRPEQQAMPLCRLLEIQGASTLRLPAVEIRGIGNRRETAARLGATETGLASWYGHPYHGRRAANGEIYDMEKMTAAHRTLPFGTRLNVINPRTGQSVTVVINDRGPFVRGVSLDLSVAAAKAIGMRGTGTVCIL